MRLKLKDLTSAVSKITSLIGVDTKTIPGVMLDIKENKVYVCYADSRKSIIEELESVTEETDVKDKIVIDYSRIITIINACQPSGNIKVDEICLEFLDDNKVKIVADKLIVVDNDGTEVTSKVSTFDQVLVWARPEDTVKTQVIIRENYDCIFNTDGADEWNTSEFKEVLDKTSNERGKTMYVAPSISKAFVLNTATVSVIPIMENCKNALVLSTSTAKSVGELLSKVDSDTIFVKNLDNKACKVSTPDGKIGVSFEIVPSKATAIRALSEYNTKKYRTYQLTFLREVINNVIKSALTASSSDKIKMTLRKNEERVELCISAGSTNSSVDNSYYMVTNGFNFENELGDTQEGIEKAISEFSISINIKVLIEMLSRCKTDYIAFDVNIVENDRCLRVSEIDSEVAENKYSELRLVKSEITMEDKLTIRDETLTAINYTIITK